MARIGARSECWQLSYGYIAVVMSSVATEVDMSVIGTQAVL